MTQEQLNSELNAIKQNQQNQQQQKANDLKQQELQLQQHQLELKTQQQNFNHKLFTGGFILASLLVAAIIIYLISKVFRSPKK